MLICGLDPGTTRSALVAYDSTSRIVTSYGVLENEELSVRLQCAHPPQCALVIEQIESFGLAVGAEVFETVFWSGRFFEAWAARQSVYRLPRRAIKLHLCGSARAKDANIRQALLDKFGGSLAIGKKATPGPLYGLHGHAFAALAVAVTWAETVGDPQGAR